MPLYLVRMPFIVSEVARFQVIVGRHQPFWLGHRLLPGRREPDAVVFEVPVQAIALVEQPARFGFQIVDTDNYRYMQIQIVETETIDLSVHISGVVINEWHDIDTSPDSTDGKFNYVDRPPKGPMVTIGAVSLPLPEGTNAATYLVLLKNPTLGDVEKNFNKIREAIKDTPAFQLMTQKIEHQRILTSRDLPFLYTLSPGGKNDIIITYYV